MSVRFLFEDGQGHIVDETGQDYFDDNDPSSLETITNYNQYTHLKPPKPSAKPEKEDQETNTANKTECKEVRRTHYNKYKDTEKETFFFLIYEKCMTAGKAGTVMGIPRRTAYEWLKRDQEDPQDEIQHRRCTKRQGRPPLLNENHKQYLIRFMNQNPLAGLNQALENLLNQFPGLSVSKSTLYNFMTKECNLSFKKTHPQ
ncbi:hypothetical protein G6F37_010694 [Rhizopus arrhizus]|nr:hypothetical protein G6F38_010733 [Rhizopus arrhizus]KAG1153063.1 hypothetical protein G6F37_010694 [Rhizopus arrhizus]